MSKKSSTPMTQSAASRIQRHADRTGTNQGFKERAQGAAAANEGGESSEGGAKK